MFIGKGDPNSNKVIIYEEGGPTYESSSDELEFNPNNENSNASEDPGFANFLKGYYRVYAHQALNVNNEACQSVEITMKQAEIENSVTVEILDRLIKHFKSQNKTVIVIGHSYGGLVITKYIAEKGNKTADKFLIMASRLDAQKVIGESFLKNTPYYFKNGITPTLDDRDEDDTTDLTVSRCPILYKVAGSIISERFTKKIKQNNLSNVMFVYSKDDTQTGDLLPNEKKFLEAKNVKVLEIPKGGHGIMFLKPYPEQIYNTFIK